MCAYIRYSVVHVSEQRVGQLMKGSDDYEVSEGYSIVIYVYYVCPELTVAVTVGKCYTPMNLFMMHMIYLYALEQCANENG